MIIPSYANKHINKILTPIAQSYFSFSSPAQISNSPQCQSSDKLGTECRSGEGGNACLLMQVTPDNIHPTAQADLQPPRSFPPKRQVSPLNPVIYTQTPQSVPTVPVAGPCASAPFRRRVDPLLCGILIGAFAAGCARLMRGRALSKSLILTGEGPAKGT